MLQTVSEEFPEISIRTFVPGDAEGITRLIRHNYGESYYKALFYHPEAIVQANETQNIISIVASFHETVVGHFSMVPSSLSNIAEIGAAVVDPAFKHLGIMNRMFDHLITTANLHRYHAIYGEGIMLHPFSQKANLHHGMVESAILLGEVPSTMEIEHRLKDSKRSGVVVSFLPFNKHDRTLLLPDRYRHIIQEAYDHANIRVYPLDTPLPPKESPLLLRYNLLLNTAIVTVDSHVSSEEIDTALVEISEHPCDMIYIDINLHRVADIDNLIRILNERLFFYSGILFSYYNNDDYLRLQHKNSSEIDEESLICFSDYAKRLLSFIRQDEYSLTQ
ncbi:MAG: GNAT family N-acetyltransferase [Sulfuricurvum sp.]|nr:GNAT family N-acetyltransferase [Sulfuricurvum sp.]